MIDEILRITLVRFYGSHPNHEQIEDYPDLRDGGDDANKRMDLITEVGDQEGREQVYQVADGGRDEGDSQCLGGTVLTCRRDTQAASAIGQRISAL